MKAETSIIEWVRSHSFLERFWCKVNKDGPVIYNLDPCWIWTSQLDTQGYGYFWNSVGLTRIAHRLSYMIEYGVVLKSKEFIMHQCDNRACVNPNHLKIGNAVENGQEASVRGRLQDQWGEKNASAKLEEKQVILIRELYARYKIPQEKLAQVFNTSRSNIGFVINRKRWANAASSLEELKLKQSA